MQRQTKKIVSIVFGVTALIVIIAGVISGYSRHSSGSGELRKKEFDAWTANFANYKMVPSTDDAAREKIKASVGECVNSWTGKSDIPAKLNVEAFCLCALINVSSDEFSQTAAAGPQSLSEVVKAGVLTGYVQNRCACEQGLSENLAGEPCRPTH